MDGKINGRINRTMTRTMTGKDEIFDEEVDVLKTTSPKTAWTNSIKSQTTGLY